MKAPVHRLDAVGAPLGIELFVQRDDLLPFPLAGNKVRKIQAELDDLETRPQHLITNGGIDSNHCRTLAIMGARDGYAVHLVLHGLPAPYPSASKSLEMISLLGATHEIVEPQQIRSAIDRRTNLLDSTRESYHVIAGGCHTPAGAIAYREAATEVFDELRPDFVFVASGTGATQGGLAAAAALANGTPRVIGISIARPQETGEPAVREAATWAGQPDSEIVFDDRFRAGGYGHWDSRVEEAVRTGWNFGIPLDPTYTGKAFLGLLKYARSGLLGGSRVLFWHTGGLWNYATGQLAPAAPKDLGDV